jgi:hypothetical protein
MLEFQRTHSLCRIYTPLLYACKKSSSTFPKGATFQCERFNLICISALAIMYAVCCSELFISHHGAGAKSMCDWVLCIIAACANGSSVCLFKLVGRRLIWMGEIKFCSCSLYRSLARCRALRYNCVSARLCIMCAHALSLFWGFIWRGVRPMQTHYYCYLPALQIYHFGEQWVSHSSITCKWRYYKYIDHLRIEQSSFI